MKKINLLVFALLCFVASNAQTSYSLKGGFGFAGASAKAGMLTFNAQSVIKPQLGITMDLSGSETFNWQTGLLLNVYGGKYASDGSASKGSIYTLSVPFLAKFVFNEKLHGYAGPQLSFSVAAQGEGTDEDYDGNKITTKESFNSNIKKPILFGVIGGGYELNDKMKAFAEYHLGLTNAVTNNTDGEVVKLNLFNIGIQYSLSK
jgi:hypothetical protein